VNRVVEPPLLDEEVERLVGAILSKPRQALAMGKQLFYRQREMGVAGGLPAGRADHGLQHDASGGAGGRAGVH
jgi:enoyl-CoA hydratase/carnithine racemase